MIKCTKDSLLKYAALVLFILIGGPCIGKSFAMSTAQKDTTDLFKNIDFRNIGPAIAGGRVSSVQGISGNPDVYYIGAGGGGVWKTTDGGYSWDDIFKDQPTSSIGDVELAPSNPNLVWVGTGEANIRNDIVDGHGVYFSPDAGATWQFKGLKNAGQISKITINPNDPKTVFVAAIGNAWSPNEQRGLFKTTDGGKSWKKVLFVNDSTGVTDVIYKPDNPEVMFAATWKVMRRPWTLIDGGKTSGMYRSTDGGDTWEKVTKGMPKGNIGRIAFATSKSNPDHIYALIAAKNGTLYDTHDGGTNWRKVSNNHALDVRPFYFSTMGVDPANDEHVYFLSYPMMESFDGGKSAKQIARGVHVDYHAIWIDPTDPSRMIVGNDGGVYISRDAGKNWHFCDNIPIEQFYMVAADSSTPYNLGGGLQDNSAWFGPARQPSGYPSIGRRWSTVAGGDGEYVVPAPSNPDIIYAESQNGSISRTNLKTGQREGVQPTFEGVSMKSPADLKYRFNWTTPIAVSATDENTVYLGANVLFKTTDGGKNWDAISPDLTRDDKSTQVVAGGPVAHDISGAETYGTIISIGLSDKDPNVIWAGTDDGQIQVTRDGGKNWDNVSGHVPDLKKGGRIYQVGVSPFDPGTAYITVDYHMMGNDHPYVYKTNNYGHSWKSINDGLPEDYVAHVVRENPNKKGFLALGTDNALYYSRDDGANWTKFNNFPTAPVYDLKFIKRDHDLVVATHGRGLFVTNNIHALEEVNDGIKKSTFHLFSNQPAILNISGAQINYYLKDALEKNKEQKKDGKTPVKITITDSNGEVVNTLYGPAKAGINQFDWNLRYKGPERLDNGGGRGYFGNRGAKANNSRGPEALPGTYKVTVTAKGETQSQPLVIKPNPNYPAFNMAGARARNKAMFAAMKDVDAMNDMLKGIDNLHKQIDHWKGTVSAQDNSDQYQSVVDQVNKLDKKVMKINNELRDTEAQEGVGEDDIHYLSHFSSWVQRAGYSLNSYDQAPSQRALDYVGELRTQLQGYITDYNKILTDDVPSFNNAAKAKDLPILLVGKPVMMK